MKVSTLFHGYQSGMKIFWRMSAIDINLYVSSCLTKWSTYAVETVSTHVCLMNSTRPVLTSKPWEPSLRRGTTQGPVILPPGSKAAENGKCLAYRDEKVSWFQSLLILTHITRNSIRRTLPTLTVEETSPISSSQQHDVSAFSHLLCSVQATFTEQFFIPEAWSN